MQTRAGQTAEFVNITTRENDLFDLLLEWSVRAPNAGDLSLGLGLAEPAGNWLDVQIDHGATLKALAALGHRIAAPERWICHWSAYLRPGLFALYRALLSGSDCLPLARLRAHLPGGKQPRWSRIRQWPSLRQPLPLPWKAAS